MEQLTKDTKAIARNNGVEKVVRERGYIVVSWSHPQPIGMTFIQCKAHILRQPFAISSETDKRDWLQQNAILNNLGLETCDDDPGPFYRAVTE